MQARNLIGSGLLAVGLLLAGCGGAPVDEEQVVLGTSEAELLDCSGLKNAEIRYFSDTTYTNMIGMQACLCGAYFRWGSTSIYSQEYDYGACY